MTPFWKKEEDQGYICVRTFGDSGMKYRPGMEFPEDSERFEELLEGGYIVPELEIEEEGDNEEDV